VDSREGSADKRDRNHFHGHVPPHSLPPPPLSSALNANTMPENTIAIFVNLKTNSMKARLRELQRD